MDFPGPPVCGSDGISYPSPCSLKIAKCMGKPDLTVAYPGKCKIEGQLILYCGLCGSDGITYPNPSSLENKKCKERPDLTVAYIGECEREGQLILMNRMSRWIPQNRGSTSMSQ